MRMFKVSARVYRAYDPAFETTVKVQARDKDHAESVAEYEIAAANTDQHVEYIEVLAVSALGEDEALRRMGAAELPLRYEV